MITTTRKMMNSFETTASMTTTGPTMLNTERPSEETTIQAPTVDKDGDNLGRGDDNDSRDGLDVPRLSSSEGDLASDNEIRYSAMDEESNMTSAITGSSTSSSSSSSSSSTSLDLMIPTMWPPEFFDAGKPENVCQTKFDAVSFIRGELYLFKGPWFWRVSEDKRILPNYPKEINKFWYSLPPDLDRIDAIYERP